MDWNSLSNTEVLIEIGSRIRTNRISKKLTQKQLAEKAGVSLFSVAKMERGEPVSISICIAILRAIRLLENLEFLFPNNTISPLAILKQNQKVEKRVRLKKS
jgi:transcriptional regulator with XRE-family HTH domain